MTVGPITIKFKDLTVFDNQVFEFLDNKINCVMGPSGCGKSTLLNYMAGLLEHSKPDTEIGYIFQEPRLLPWLTVMKNITEILPDSFSKKEKSDAASQFLEAVGLKDFKEYYPQKLSGGMRHRVSIARAFSRPCSLLLMDEPFTGQDIKTKNELISLFLSLWEKDKKTVLAVTHDYDEAWRLGDSICVLSPAPARVVFSEIIAVPCEKNKRKDKMYIEQESELNKKIENAFFIDADSLFI